MENDLLLNEWRGLLHGHPLSPYLKTLLDISFIMLDEHTSVLNSVDKNVHDPFSPTEGDRKASNDIYLSCKLNMKIIVFLNESVK